METRDLLLIGALVLSGCGGAFVCAFVVDLLKRSARGRRAAARGAGVGSGREALLVSGLPMLRAPVRLLLRNAAVGAFAENLCLGLQAQGRACSTEGALCVLLVGGGALSLAFFAVSGSPVCALAVLACVVGGVGAWSTRRRDEMREQMREALPEALQTMKACFRVGYSLPQTVRETANAISGPLHEVFEEMWGVLRTGGRTDEALSVLKAKGREPELAFLAAALEVQHRSGGSMQQILEIARQSVADEVALKRSLRTQTAQARLSAQIITVMPFALVALFSLVSPGFASPFLESPLGIVVLGAALAMQMLGIVLVRRMLKVEVV